jgi:hypothetical protein
MTSLLLLAALAATPAPPEPPRGEEVSIPFANHYGAIRNFEATSDDVLYLQDRQKRWYRAEIGGPCFNLRFATAIGYDTRGSLSLDRFSHIIVGRDRCPIVSLTRSDGPPRKAKKH